MHRISGWPDIQPFFYIRPDIRLSKKPDNLPDIRPYMQLRKNFEILYSLRHSPINRLHVTSADLFWPFVIPYDFSRPHGTSADQPYVTSAEQPYICDLSLPPGTPAALVWPLHLLVIFNDLIGPTLNSNDLSLPHRASCDLSRHSVTLPILMGPQMTLEDLIWPQPTSCDLIWPMMNPLKPWPISFYPMWPHVTSCEKM